MSNLLTRLIGDRDDKLAWRAMEARARQLPREYRLVHARCKAYMWRFTTGDGTDVVEALRGVLEDFEEGARAGRPVLEVTGADVAAFCDARLEGVASYVDRWRESLDRGVARDLAG